VTKTTAGVKAAMGVVRAVSHASAILNPFAAASTAKLRDDTAMHAF
jgi:hypothetical protein